MSAPRELEDLVASGPVAFEMLAEHLDEEWTRAALSLPREVKVRNRKRLLALVIWLVIGMGLFGWAGIPEVVAHLGVSGVMGRPLRKRTLAASSIAEARDRLGEEPMAWMFQETGKVWGDATSDENRWHGLALYVIDGMTLNVPDTEKNREEL